MLKKGTTQTQIIDTLKGVIDPANNAIDVNVQSSTNPLFQQYLVINEKTDILLTESPVIDSHTIKVTPGHGFQNYLTAPDQLITLWDDQIFAQYKIVNVVGDTITVNAPITNTYSIDGTKVTRSNKNLAKVGTVGAPVIAEFRPLGGTDPIDISALILRMESTSEPDDSKFGGGAALINGLHFRHVLYIEGVGNINVNLGDFDTNGKFTEFGAIVSKQEKVGGGVWSTRINIDIINSFNQELRNRPRGGVNPDCLKTYITEDLTVGNSKIYMSLIGSFTSGEA